MARPHLKDRQKVYQKEEKCFFCPFLTVDMAIHIDRDHKEMRRMSDIIWISQHEAVFKGRRYRKLPVFRVGI